MLHSGKHPLYHENAMSVQTQPASEDATTANSRTMFTAMCGIALIAGLVVAGLGHEEFFEDAAANLLLILDFPPGYALAILALPTMRSHHSVVVTSSSAPEYWNDLSDMGAQIVIAGDYSAAVLAEALRHAAMGARYQLTPTLTTALTPIQRRALHLLAYGFSNQQIAEQTNMKEQSVKNLLTETYHKLGIADRNAAQNYYWGIWPAGAADESPDEPESEK
jgi:DNA-binding CsgD family transcriptional regulator